MDRQLVRFAPGPEFGVCSTINMNLPGHRVQWGIIVEIIRGDPRQSITAVYVTGMPLAQSTMTVVDGDLRHRSEQEFAKDFEL